MAVTKHDLWLFSGFTGSFGCDRTSVTRKTIRNEMLDERSPASSVYGGCVGKLGAVGSTVGQLLVKERRSYEL